MPIVKKADFDPLNFVSSVERHRNKCFDREQELEIYSWNENKAYLYEKITRKYIFIQLGRDLKKNKTIT